MGLWRKNSRIWMVVGVLLTVASALISHYLIKSNSQHIMALQSQVAELDTQISQRWQSATTLERREDFGIVLMLLTKNKDDEETRAIIDQYVRKTLTLANAEDDAHTILLNESSSAWLHILMDAVQNYKKAEIQKIDTLYIEKLELDHEIKLLEERNTSLSGIALFLQIMGMILVLSASRGVSPP